MVKSFFQSRSPWWYIPKALPMVKEQKLVIKKLFYTQQFFINKLEIQFTVNSCNLNGLPENLIVTPFIIVQVRIFP
jgi:hypothetical protein